MKNVQPTEDILAAKEKTGNSIETADQFIIGVTHSESGCILSAFCPKDKQITQLT